MALSFWIAAAIWYAMRSTIRLPVSELTVFRRRKAFLLCKNPCGGTAVGMGSPAQSAAAPPAQRNFQRKFALRRGGSSKFVVPPTRERSKVRNHARLEKFLYRAAPGCQREESRGTPSKGFLWATSSRRLDTALLFADKKRGVETTRLAGHCQSTPGPRTTGPAKKPPLRAGSKKPVFSS